MGMMGEQVPIMQQAAGKGWNSPHHPMRGNTAEAVCSPQPVLPEKGASSQQLEDGSRLRRSRWGTHGIDPFLNYQKLSCGFCLI
jgi:hypothetical protein